MVYIILYVYTTHPSIAVTAAATLIHKRGIYCESNKIRLLNLFSGSERMKTFNKSRADYFIIYFIIYTRVRRTYVRFCDSCPVRIRTAYRKRNSLRYIIIILLGVVTVFGSEPLVNIIGGVPTERPCLYSYIIFVYVYCIPDAMRAMIEVVFR